MACAKRFQLTKSGNVKFHPRSNPGKVYYVKGNSVIKTFRDSLFARSYSKTPTFYVPTPYAVEVIDLEDGQEMPPAQHH
eukprot:gene2089-2379_t